MKNLKKISCLLLSGVLLAGGVGLQKASAASNHSDTAFSLGAWSKNSYTGARKS